jgi:CubicO group peptidase (beta-lactamase class C family)
MAACKASPLLSAPGAEANPWSDCNTLLLSTILEKVTGKTWADAMQGLVFKPADMTNSGRMTNALKPPQRGRLYSAGAPTQDLNYDGFYLAYITGEDVIRLNHALLAGALLTQRSLNTMFTPLFHDDAADSNSPWRGYEVIMSPETAKIHKAICESCMNGGGEDQEGRDAGFFMTVTLSPGAGSLQMEINNDSAYFNPGADDNAFAAFISKPLYGK